MKLKPNYPYFLVRCAKGVQSKLRNKIGSIDIAETYQDMVYNMEWGEIMGIGRLAGNQFPDAKVGDTLIFHHFVQGIDKEDSKESHLVHEDKDYNYYVVTASRFNGKRNETYGVISNGEIIPHPNYIFLEPEKPSETYATPDEFLNAKTHVTGSGLLVFSEWADTRESIELRMQKLKEQNEELARFSVDNREVKEKILQNEQELSTLSNKINATMYLPYTVAAFNKNSFLIPDKGDIPLIEKGGIVYVNRHATEKIVTVIDKKYRVTPIDYVWYAPLSKRK